MARPRVQQGAAVGPCVDSEAYAGCLRCPTVQDSGDGGGMCWSYVRIRESLWLERRNHVVGKEALYGWFVDI